MRCKKREEREESNFAFDLQRMMAVRETSLRYFITRIGSKEEWRSVLDAHLRKESVFDMIWIDCPFIMPDMQENADEEISIGALDAADKAAQNKSEKTDAMGHSFISINEVADKAAQEKNDA